MTMWIALAFISAAWRPLLDPIEVHRAWLLLLPPIVFVVALVYKTLKLPTLDRLAAETIRLTAMILLVMAAAAAALWVVTTVV